MCSKLMLFGCVSLLMASCKKENPVLDYSESREIELGSESLKVTDGGKNWEVNIVSTESGVHVTVANLHGQVISHSSYNESSEASHSAYNPGEGSKIITINAKGELKKK